MFCHWNDANRLVFKGVPDIAGVMVDKGKLSFDPRGLIYEAYRIDGITEPECRSIFLDWALGTQLGADMGAMLRGFMAEYGEKHPDHPMTAVLKEGLEKTNRPLGRRGGRQVRL